MSKTFSLSLIHTLNSDLYLMFQNSEFANLYNKLLPLFTRILMNFLTFQSIYILPSLIFSQNTKDKKMFKKRCNNCILSSSFLRAVNLFSSPCMKCETAKNEESDTIISKTFPSPPHQVKQ